MNVACTAADLSLGGYFLQIDLLGLDPYEGPLGKSLLIITTSNELNSFANCSGCFQGPNDELARSRQIRWSCGMISMVETGDRAEQGRRQGLSASSETHARMGLGYAILSWIMSAGLLSPETDAINTSQVGTAEACFSPSDVHLRPSPSQIWRGYGIWDKAIRYLFQSQLDSM